MSQTRQLAAIMFADIMGFTAIMESDESLAMSFREKLKRKLEIEVELHGGRIIKFSGDGAICTFNSAGESIRAALGVQSLMQDHPKVPVRIGIHQADVVFEESDVHGDGVNIAARLESLAVPGSIFISAKVFDDIKNQNDIQTISLGRYVLKNVKEPIEIFAISNPGLQLPGKKRLEGKGVKYAKYNSPRARKKILIRWVLPFLVLATAAFFVINPWMKKQHARNKLLPALQKLASENYLPGIEAFNMAVEAKKYIGDDSAFVKVWPLVTLPLSVNTEPPGAEIFWKDYNKLDADWRSAGSTPLDSVRIPRAFLRGEIRKAGYQTIEFAAVPGLNIKLDKEGTLPPNMVRIPSKISAMTIVGLEGHGGRMIGEFLIDKYEVSNKQFKAFVDAGGYKNKKYWNYPTSDGKDISIAIAGFTDRTGRQGPANWEAGTYPDGQENHPVTGISWYEASAYASFVNKQLPTIFHFSVIAFTNRTEYIVPLSNFSGKSTSEVGSMKGISSYGIYDVAGNAREWCFNESAIPNQRYILGGGWNDPTYSFNDSYTQNELDRSVSNGFRCIKELPGDTSMIASVKPIAVAFRDYRKEKPVDDQTFNIFLRQFSYDKTPLEPKVEGVIESESWTAEKVSINVGYNNERIWVYVYLPKNMKPPYQSVVFFPGSGVIFSKKYNPFEAIRRVDFILKSGRALIVPIFKGTHERHDSLRSDLPNESVFYKDHVIMWRKDVGRALDYLETRKELQSDKIGFIGYSWGGFLGGIIPAIERRFKVIVLNVGGMVMDKALPEVDQLNFLPRVTQPVLMLNGKHDMFFPVETSQKPMFDLLGTPKKDKKIIIYEAGHQVPLIELAKESLLWYDKYLGVVR